MVILHRMWIDGTEFNWSKKGRLLLEERVTTGVPAKRREKTSQPGTRAMVSSTDFLRASERTTGDCNTLNRQRRLMPSCGGFTPTAERTVDPAK